jgi:hypothetical protein
MKRCRLKRYNFKIRNKMSKENEPLGKQQNGNDFIADVMHWVACKDETPKEVRRVLAIMSSGLVSVCYVWQGEWYMNDKADTAEHYGYEVTHWMPLPPPPCL